MVAMCSSEISVDLQRYIACLTFPIVLTFIVVFVVVVVLSLYLCNRICFVFIVVGCHLLLCFVYCVLIECVVTLCNVCYLSVVSLFYYCHRAKTQLQSNNIYIYIYNPRCEDLRSYTVLFCVRKIFLEYIL
jgi:hypothetical protein